MSDHAMPLLILNMGGEMLYILEQRLHAQSIIEDKSVRVLQDVISTMFSEKFLGELFKPQRLYSSSSTRQIFDRLAHSSIMRLNQSSMDKLYDLMTMGCKYQILSVSNPSDLLAICLNHMDSLRKLVYSNPEVAKLVELATQQILELFKLLKPSQLFVLRYTLSRFFQDRRVKVSLFLQDQLQLTDGSIIMSHKGRVAKGSEVPGTIRYFDDGKLIREEILKLPNSNGVQNYGGDVDIFKTPRQCELGLNLYSKDRKKAATAATGNAAVAASSAAAASKFPLSSKSRGSASGRSAGLNEFDTDDRAKKAAKAELNLLASMIGNGGNTGNNSNNNENFSLINLFPDTSLQADEFQSRGDTRARDFITFESEDVGKEIRNRMGKLGFDDDEEDGKKNNNKNDEEQDLLELMDSQAVDDEDN